MQTGKIENTYFKFPLEEVYKSLFQEDFSVIERNLKTTLRFDCSLNDLFEIILCDFMKRIKDCSNASVKLMVLKNAMKTLEYLGFLYIKEANDAGKGTICLRKLKKETAG